MSEFDPASGGELPQLFQRGGAVLHEQVALIEISFEIEMLMAREDPQENKGRNERRRILSPSCWIIIQLFGLRSFRHLSRQLHGNDTFAVAVHQPVSIAGEISGHVFPFLITEGKIQLWISEAFEDIAG